MSAENREGGSAMEQKQIIELFLERSEKAIEAAQAKYGSLCHGIAWNLLGSELDVEECLNDTWHVLWNAIPPQQPENLGAFAAKITRNLAMKRLAHMHAEKRTAVTVSYEELSQCIPDRHDPEELLQSKELIALLERFLRNLDGLSRDLFLRRYWFFDSIEQLSKDFLMSQTRVTTRLYRIRKKLKDYLEREGQIHVE